jgi:hypothetical protein
MAFADLQPVMFMQNLDPSLRTVLDAGRIPVATP